MAGQRASTVYLTGFAALLFLFGWLADRALVAESRGAERVNYDEAMETARLAADAVRSELGQIELGVVSGDAEPSVTSLRLAPESRAGFGSFRPYLERSRSELLGLIQYSTATTPSGLPESVVAAVALGDAGRLNDVVRRVLAGEVPVRLEELSSLASILGAGEDARWHALRERLSRAPQKSKLPRFPDFSRALVKARVVSGWTLYQGGRLGYEITTDELFRRAGVPGQDPTATRVMDTQVPDVTGLHLRLGYARRERGSAFLRMALWAAVFTTVAAAVAAERSLRREVVAVAKEKAFLANVSHELRTPLTAIRVFGETLADGKGNPEDYGKLISAESQRLETLVNQVLTATRAEEAVELAPTKPGTIVAEAVRLLHNRSERRGVTVEVRSALSDGFESKWDEAAVRRAVVNLVDNAIQHGRPAGNVRVELVQSGEDVVISVRDDGPGIAPTDRRRLFKRFSRGRTESPGIGLGLYVVERVARAHGGRVDLSTGEGVGCTFRLFLPAAPRSAIGKS